MILTARRSTASRSVPDPPCNCAGRRGAPPRGEIVIEVRKGEIVIEVRKGEIVI